MSDTRGKILVIRGGAIGDFILTLPALAALRERFGEVQRELLTYPRVAPLALAANLVHRAEAIDARPMASFFARGGPLPDVLAEYFSQFAIILSYLFDPDAIFEQNVARCSKAQFIPGPHRPDERAALHATEAFLQPLQRLAIYDADSVPKLELIDSPEVPALSKAHSAAVHTPSMARSSPHSAWLALHPGSGSERKNWPMERWSSLLTRLLQETQFSFLLIGGEADVERVRRLAEMIPQARIELAVQRPLVALATRMRSCQAYIGHDSGISHLAAAVGLKGVILWGDTNSRIWQPRSDRLQLVSSPFGLAELTLDEVWKALVSARVVPLTPG